MKQLKKSSFKSLVLFLVIVLLIAGVLVGILQFLPQGGTSSEAKTIAVKAVSAQILADGSVVSQNEAVLHFQTGGKLTYLPFKEGDSVTAGQTIAGLDAYALERDVELAANAYETAKNNNDTTRENNQAGVLEGNQRTSLDTYNHNPYTNTTEARVITDEVKRLVDNSSLAQNTAQLKVDLAKYAQSLATLTTPISGVITHEDVTQSGVNVTAATSFTVDDPASLVFRANVLENNIDFIAVGQPVTIKMASGKTFQGTVEKIYPEKVTLSSGDKAYQVDVVSGALESGTTMGETGSALIQSTAGQDMMLVPTWTVINQKYVWIEEDGQPVLKRVTVGQEHGAQTEILSGLSKNDSVIENPSALITGKYKLLPI